MVLSFGKVMSLFSNKSNESADVLSKLLADSYVLLLKTQNIHWNIEGSKFRSIHLMTEEHYNNLFDAVDVIAERIRMIGEKAPATFAEFSKLASFDEKVETDNQNEMLESLLASHEALRADVVSGLKRLEDSNDFGTIDVLNSRLAFHDKIIWMLKSTLKK